MTNENPVPKEKSEIVRRLDEANARWIRIVAARPKRPLPQTYRELDLVPRG